MLALGVTGDVGAGKSTLTGAWRDAGASVLDADGIVRALWSTGAVRERAVRRWGERILNRDGAVIPSEVAKTAFRDAVEYRWLCDLLHPLVRIEMERAIASLGGWVVAEIPLLFEGGVPQWIDATVYVTASLAVRRQRNRARGWDDGEILRREAFLLPGEEKSRLATVVLRNEGTREAFLLEASEMAARFRDMAEVSRAEIAFGSIDERGSALSFLAGSRLGTKPSLRKFRDGSGAERFGLSFFTLERFFNDLRAPGSPVGTDLLLFPIRRMPFEARRRIREELRP